MSIVQLPWLEVSSSMRSRSSRSMQRCRPAPRTLGSRRNSSSLFCRTSFPNRQTPHGRAPRVRPNVPAPPRNNNIPLPPTPFDIWCVCRSSDGRYLDDSELDKMTILSQNLEQTFFEIPVTLLATPPVIAKFSLEGKLSLSMLAQSVYDCTSPQKSGDINLVGGLMPGGSTPPVALFLFFSLSPLFFLSAPPLVFRRQSVFLSACGFSPRSDFLVAGAINGKAAIAVSVGIAETGVQVLSFPTPLKLYAAESTRLHILSFFTTQWGRALCSCWGAFLDVLVCFSGCCCVFSGCCCVSLMSYHVSHVLPCVEICCVAGEN